MIEKGLLGFPEPQTWAAVAAIGFLRAIDAWRNHGTYAQTNRVAPIGWKSDAAVFWKRGTADCGTACADGGGWIYNQRRHQAKPEILDQKLRALKTLARYLLFAAAIPPSVFGHGCALPTSLCERLNPGMVVFIGREVSLLRDRHSLPTVTFEIQEHLWGLSNERVATVLFADGYGASKEPQFLAVTPTVNGQYRHDDCGRGLLLPLDHPWVQEFRRNVAAHRPARVPVIVHSKGDYVPVAGTQVRLSGNGRVLGGRTGGLFRLEFGRVPPGNYHVTAARPNFTHADDRKQVSILPGSCAPLRIRMAPVSAVSGRIVDFRGEPVRSARFHLTGRVPSNTLNDSIYDSITASVRNVFFRLLGWDLSSSRGHPIGDSVRTDSDGRFVFTDVFPGTYYLVSDIEDVNEASQAPFPKTYYPGVYHWRRATPLLVEEGRSIDNVLFQLPYFGKKRRVEIQVVSEDGVPVAGAIVQDGGLDPGNEKAANVGTRGITDVRGRVAFDVWPISEYRLAAALYLPKKWYSCDVLDVPSGASPFSRVIVLKGFRLGNGGKPKGA